MELHSAWTNHYCHSRFTLDLSMALVMNWRTLGSSVCILAGAVLGGCSRENSWPPPLRNQQEKLLVEAARRAVDQFDGWSDVACLVERRNGAWRVQAWRIVNPKARGRSQCVPWAVRGITLDDHAKVLAYENHL
jgi:hypothetical protein